MGVSGYVEDMGKELIYEISTRGRIRYMDWRGKRRMLKPQKAANGYMRIRLSKRGYGKYFNIHRLVALEFLPNSEEKPHVNHLDGNKSNNFIENLEWCTPKENTQHGIKMNGGRWAPAEAKKKKIKQLSKNGELIKIWDSATEAALAISGFSTRIAFVARGKPDVQGRVGKTAYGFRWEYA